jgi:hypothetical protein
MRLCLSILSGCGSESVRASWQDNDEGKLESQMTEVAVQVILTERSIIAKAPCGTMNGA